MDLADAVAFARTVNHGVLLTLRSNGHPQASNVAYAIGEDGVVRISITADRAKYPNLSRRPWAALHVTPPDFFPYVVLEGDVALTPVAAAPDDPTVDALVGYYRAIHGEHEDWDEYRRAMVADRRLLVRLTPDHAYGTAPSPG